MAGFLGALAIFGLPWLVRALSPAQGRSSNGVPLPRTVHAVHRSPPSIRRVLVVGDVHGCLDELLDLLRVAEFDPLQDELVLVGDLVNKGPKSAEVVRWARERSVLAVRGNHDDAALSVLRRSGKWAAREPPPSYAYLSNLSEADVAYLQELPYTLSLPELRVLVVHAGLVPGRELSAQLPHDMFKMRTVLPASDAPGAPLAACERAAEGSAPWARVYGGELGHVVFGHDAKRGLQREASATGLDTGCCYGGRLTALVLPEHRLVSTPARRVYERPGGGGSSVGGGSGSGDVVPI